jgi:hypothetical protein
VSTIALLCLVLLCTPVQLADCSLAALQADLLFTPVNTCSVYSLEALQANFEDPFLEPPTHSWENILLSFELYEIEISVATSMSTYIVASLPLPLYCGILLLAKQHETIQGLSCGITAGFDCGIMPALLWLDCRLDSPSHRTTCGITAGLSDIYTAHR